IFSMLRSATGVDFTHYKSPTIRRRLQRRMVLHRLSSLKQYVAYLQKNPPEVERLYQDILIHVTRFFRDPESYKALAETVFPHFLENRKDDQPVRIWIPGCATGEEAYSVAIALLEFMEENNRNLPIQIFATDISEPAIDFARAGLYPPSIAA